MPIGIGGASLIGSGISGIGSIFGAGKSANAATQAAQIQANAAEQASALQYAMYNQTAARLEPWTVAGQSALTPLQNLTGAYAGANPMESALGAIPGTWGMQTEFNPTMSALQQTPGYQFTLQQGEQATTNQYAAQGLGGSITGRTASPSGPLGAGLTQYASGLASQTFNQQYQNWLAGQNFQQAAHLQTYNMLAGLSGSGQNAAANTGSFGSAAAQAASGYLTSGAAASAAGVVGSANALNAGLSGATNSISSGLLTYALLNNGMFGGNAANSSSLAAPQGGTGGLY